MSEDSRGDYDTDGEPLSPQTDLHSLVRTDLSKVFSSQCTALAFCGIVNSLQDYFMSQTPGSLPRLKTRYVRVTHDDASGDSHRCCPTSHDDAQLVLRCPLCYLVFSAQSGPPLTFFVFAFFQLTFPESGPRFSKYFEVIVIERRFGGPTNATGRTPDFFSRPG